MHNARRPQRGEIWLVNLDPTVGAEIQKTRPAVVVSVNGLRSLPVRLVAPITGWQEWYADDFWHLPLIPDAINRLDKPSAVDLLQIRSLDEQRFVRWVGRVPAQIMEEIAVGIALLVGYSPE